MSYDVVRRCTQESLAYLGDLVDRDGKVLYNLSVALLALADAVRDDVRRIEAQVAALGRRPPP